MSGQQREAQKAWEAIRPRTPGEFLTPKIYFDAGVAAALTVREEPQKCACGAKCWRVGGEAACLYVTEESAIAAREEKRRQRDFAAGEDQTPTPREQELEDTLADALLWLERVPPPEEEIRALGRGLWDETLEKARALLAAREDTERPDADREEMLDRLERGGDIDD